MTTNEKNALCKATAQWNCGDYDDEIGRVCEPDQVAVTRDTVDNFKLQWGAPKDIIETPGGKLLFWEKIQVAKGYQRGELFVMDLGEHRLAYFSGQWRL